MLTKKHYIEIALILKRNIIQINGIGSFNAKVMEDLESYFKSDNPNFNEETFRKAVLN